MSCIKGKKHRGARGVGCQMLNVGWYKNCFLPACVTSFPRLVFPWWLFKCLVCETRAAAVQPNVNSYFSLVADSDISASG